MFRVALATMLLGTALGGVAYAETPLDNRALQACGTVGADQQRLACYDGIVRNASRDSGEGLSATPKPQAATAGAGPSVMRPASANGSAQ